MIVTRQLAGLVIVFLGCTPKPSQTIPIAVLVDGDRAAIGELPRTAVTGLELTPLVLPEPAPIAASDDTATVTRARITYGKGDFDACHGELSKLDVAKLLAAHDRALAARLLFLDAACAWGATDKAAAQAIAARFASFGLAVPDLAVSPDVERVFGDAITAAGKAPHTPLEITGEPGARLTIDGREAGCTLPCTLDVGPGDHVLAVDADGFQPAARTVRAPSPPIAIAQSAATAELAARQWRARIGRGLPPADVVGARLLGRVGRGPRVAIVHGDTRLTGSLVVDGVLVATATGEREGGPALIRELAYDGGILRRPALWQRPWFWIAASSVAVLAAGTIVAITYQPPIRTNPGF